MRASGKSKQGHTPEKFRGNYKDPPYGKPESEKGTSTKLIRDLNGKPDATNLCLKISMACRSVRIYVRYRVTQG